MELNSSSSVMAVPVMPESLLYRRKIVLEGDGGQRLGLVGDGDALLGLDGLMQALVVAAAEHQAAGELVHDDDLTVLDHIVHVPLHDAAGAGWPD